MDFEQTDPSWRPDDWSVWPFEEKYDWLVAHNRFSSLTISQYSHDNAGHAEYLEKVNDPISIDEIRRRYGPGRYDLRVNIQGGGSGARDPNFRIAQARSAQVQHSVAPTYPTYGRQDHNSVSNPPRDSGLAHNQPGGQPSSTDLLLIELIQEMRGKSKPESSLLSAEDYERRIRDERERYERQRDEERQRFERERREAEEKAKMQAEIDALKRDRERADNEPRKQLENDSGLVSTLIDKFTALSTQPQERAKVDETLRDPFAVIDKIHGVAGKMQPNAASTAATVLEGMSNMLTPAVSMIGEMLAAGRETQLEILKMKTAAEIRNQDYELEKRRRIDDVSFERVGLPPPQPAPRVEFEPEAPEVSNEDREHAQMAKVARTFLTTLIKSAQKNADEPVESQASVAQIVDFAIAATLKEHRSPDVFDFLFDSLDPWVFSNIQTEADELAFIKFLCSKLRMSDSILVASQKNNPQVRAGVLQYFREVQVMLQGLKGNEDAVAERWEEIFEGSGMHPATEA